MKNPSPNEIDRSLRIILTASYDSLLPRHILCKLVQSHILNAEVHRRKRNERIRDGVPHPETSSPDSSSDVIEFIGTSTMVEIDLVHVPNDRLGALLLDLAQSCDALKQFLEGVDQAPVVPQQWKEDPRVELCVRFEGKEKRKTVQKLTLLELFQMFLAERSLALQYENWNAVQTGKRTGVTEFARYTRSFDDKSAAVRSTDRGIKGRELEFQFRNLESSDGEPGVSAVVFFKRSAFYFVPKIQIPLLAKWLRTPLFNKVLDLGKRLSPLVR
jgi:hypothetical protein